MTALIGPRLKQFELAERAQKEGVFLVDEISANDGIMSCRLGASFYTVPEGASAQHIVVLARRIGVTASDVPEGFQTEVDEPTSVWSAWAQLHYDLGTFETELLVGYPKLGLRRIAREGSLATVSISDGRETGSYVKLLGDRVLDGLTVELAMSFRTRAPSMTFTMP